MPRRLTYLEGNLMHNVAQKLGSARSGTRRRHRLAVTAIAAVALTTLLAGCTSGGGALGGGGADAQGKVTELIIPTNTSPWLSAYEAVAAAYTKKTGVKVTFRTFPYAGLLTQEANAVQQKSLAFDVLQLDEPWTSQFYDLGWAQPLTSINPGFKLDPAINTFDALPFWDKSTHSSSTAGEVYGVPVNGNLRIFVYRTDIYSKLGLKVPTTWDEAISNGKAIEAAKAAPYGYVVRAKDGGTPDFSDVLSSYGANWFEKTSSGYVPSVDTPKALKAMSVYQQLGDLGPNPDTVDQAGMVSLMQSGKVAQASLVASTLAQLLDPTKSLVSGKLGFAVVPGGPAGVTPTSATWSLAVPVGLPHNRAAAALAFIQFATSAEGQTILLKDGNGGGIPVRSDVLNGGGAPALAAPWLPAYKDSLKKVKSAYRYPFNAAFIDVASKGMNDVLGHNVGVDTGMSTMQASLKSVVGG